MLSDDDPGFIFKEMSSKRNPRKTTFRIDLQLLRKKHQKSNIEFFIRSEMSKILQIKQCMKLIQCTYFNPALYGENFPKFSSSLDTLYTKKRFLHFWAKNNLFLYTWWATCPFSPQKCFLDAYSTRCPSKYPYILESAQGRVKMNIFQYLLIMDKRS